MKEFFSTYIQHLIYYRNKNSLQDIRRTRWRRRWGEAYEYESNEIDILKDFFYVSWYLDDKLYRCEGKYNNEAQRYLNFYVNHSPENCMCA